MVDSGNQRNEGSVDCYHVYKRMVDASLARPAQAEIQAYCWRTGNPAVCYAQVTNLSPLTLSGSANSAAVHAIAYEDARVGVTDRFGRRAGMYEMPSLAPGATGVFRVGTGNLSGTNWDGLHVVVLVDYRPPGSLAFDMLQAVSAFLTIRGDVDADCDVDIADIMQVASHWGTRSGDANYSRQYDLDGDWDIDVVDIMYAAAMWGQSC